MKRVQINTSQVYLENFHRSCRNSYTRNKISIKHLLTATGNVWNYFWQSLTGLHILKKVRLKIYQSQKSIVKTLLIIFLLKKTGMTESAGTANLFNTILVHSNHLSKKMVFVIKYLLLMLLILFRVGRGAKSSLSQPVFPSGTSTNVKISLWNILTSSFNPFATLV